MKIHLFNINLKCTKMKKFTKPLSLALLLSIFFIACTKNEDTVVPTPEVKLEGVQGEWQSSGDNVAPLLAIYFKVDSIYAKFNTDNTYNVESYDSSGVKTEYTGTYVQTKDANSNIYTIKLNQATPSVGTSEGIFEIYTDETNYDMQYEVVQTQPDIGNVPPTASKGFGSSNNGSLGTSNVQKYFRIKE